MDDDDLVEKTESFNVAVDDTPVLFIQSIITNQRQHGVINILDNDGMNCHSSSKCINSLSPSGCGIYRGDILQCHRGQ